MIRKWIYVDDINPYSHFHFKADNEHGFDVNQEDDGQSLEDHVIGINYIKSVIEDGRKIVPILVEETSEGHYRELDGFKRLMAHRLLGRKIIECFVPSKEEMEQGKKFHYLGLVMECKPGGQSYFHTRLPLIDGADTVSEPSLGEIYTLFHGGHIRIEYAENFHIHFGDHGKYRIEVGRDDFMGIADAFRGVEL